MLFDVQRREYRGWMVLTVVGELDLAAVPRVRQAVVAALGPVSPARSATVGDGREPIGTPLAVALDLSGVDFIDSAGLGAVLGAVRRVRATGGRFALVIDSPRVLGVFSLLDLDQILAISPTLEALGPAPAAEASAAPGDGGGVRG